MNSELANFILKIDKRISKQLTRMLAFGKLLDILFFGTQFNNQSMNVNMILVPYINMDKAQVT